MVGPRVVKPTMPVVLVLTPSIDGGLSSTSSRNTPGARYSGIAALLLRAAAAHHGANRQSRVEVGASQRTGQVRVCGGDPAAAARNTGRGRRAMPAMT